MSRRISSQPQRYQDEQEDELVYAMQLSMLLQATRPSQRPVVMADDSDETDEEEEEQALGSQPADEQDLVRSLSDAQQRLYAEHTENDEKAGWQERCSDSGQHTFTPGRQPVGCLLPDTLATPLDFFEQFITPDLIIYFCERTNENAIRRERQKRTENKENVDPDGTDSDEDDEGDVEWTAVTPAEMRAFLGCVICMGIVVLRNTKQYWNEDVGPLFIRRAFPRKRFLQLLASFHMSEPVDPVDPTVAHSGSTDRLHKVRQLNDRLSDRFALAFYPSQWLAVDEAMVGFKGRCVMKQHIPKKTSDTGFKVWMLVDCATNYVVKFEVYQGRQEDGPEAGLAYGVVQRLTADLRPRAWHALAMDGFFSSIKLFLDLYTMGVLAVGTVRSYVTDFPQAPLLVNTKLRRGQFIARQQPLAGQHDALTLVSWKDNRPVNLLTTTADPLTPASTRRWFKTRRAGARGQHRQVSCPQVRETYGTYMRGVDVYSQRESYARIGRKTVRWWPRLAWFMIDMAICNAHVLYQQRGITPKLTPTLFRERLMESLVDGFTQRKKRGRPEKVPLSLDVPHIPVRLTTEQSCAVCKKTRKRKSGQHQPRTRDGCQTCGLAVHFTC